MNIWEKFLIDQISKDKDISKEILDPVIEIYLMRYRQNQFNTVPQLIYEARKLLDREMVLKNKNINNNSYVKSEGK